MDEIEAHKRTDAALQKAKEVAEAANRPRPATSSASATRCARRSTPSSAMRRSAGTRPALPPRRDQRHPRRSAAAREHLSNLIDGLLDISKIENGRLQLNRDEVRHRGIPGPDRRHVPPAGDAPRASSSATSRRSTCRADGARRREAPAADPDQPALERDQVHGARPRRLTRAAIAARSRSSRFADTGVGIPGGSRAHLRALRARRTARANATVPAPASV